jgi:hypothetical protein
MNEYVHRKVLSMHVQVFSKHGRDLLDDARGKEGGGRHLRVILVTMARTNCLSVHLGLFKFSGPKETL